MADVPGPFPAGVRRLYWALGTAAGIFGAVSLVAGTRRDPGWDSFWVVIEFLVAVFAAAAATRAAVRHPGARRTSWGWLAAGLAGWALGEAWWTVRELFLGIPMGVPSPADVGFLLLPVCAAIGLVTHPAARTIRMSQRVRLLLDAAGITTALMLFSWMFPITAVIGSTDGAAGTAVALAYPLSDVLLAAILLTMLTHGAGRRRQVHLIWLLAGLLSLTGADSIFCYLAGSGNVSGTSIADLLWTVGFAAIGIAALNEPGGSVGTHPGGSPTREWLPNALLAASVLIVSVRWFTGTGIDAVTIVLLCCVALLAYTRQYLLLRDKQRLVAQVRDGRDRLRDSGRYDALTGLPNRVGLLDLVGEALIRSGGGSVSVVKLRPAHRRLLENLPADETDAIMFELGGRIAGCLRPGDRLGRISDGSFAALIAGDQEPAVEFARRVMLTADAAVPTGYRRLRVGLTAGVAAGALEPIRRDPPGEPARALAETLAERAALALNSVAAQPGGIAVFEPSMLRAHSDHLELREVVARSLDGSGPSAVHARFEPVVELPTGRLAGIAASPGIGGGGATGATGGTAGATGAACEACGVGGETGETGEAYGGGGEAGEACGADGTAGEAGGVGDAYGGGGEAGEACGADGTAGEAGGVGGVGEACGAAGEADADAAGRELSAERLIALARESGMAERVDDIVIPEAVTHFGRWLRRWPDAGTLLWVGVSAETLARPGFPDRLAELLDSAGVPARAIVLEPVDYADGGGPDDGVSGALRDLRQLGIQLAVRDSMMLSGYGTVPTGVEDRAEYFDIPPVLVERCESDIRARRLVQATAEFAASHGARAAAREVSTGEQHEELLQAGCSLARGPLYGSPLPPGGVENLLAAVTAGTWRTPAGPAARRHRSSLAWQKLREVVSGLPIAAFACGPDGTLDLAEGALLERLGIDSEIIGRPFAALLGRDPDQAANRRFDDAVRAAFNGTPTVNTVRVDDRWLQVHLCPDLDGCGQVTGILGVAIDVTHRVQAEEALRRSEQRFKSMFADAPIGMAIVAPDARVQEANRALASMLGYLPEELVGLPLSSLWHASSPAGTAGEYEAVRRGRTTGYRAERAYRHRDGAAVWTRVTVGALADERAPGTIIAVVEDLRQVKRLEVELRHAQKLEAVGMLAAGIAHEINTPTQFVGDNLNFLGEAFGQLVEALSSARRLSRPVDDAAATELESLSSAVDLPWLVEEVPEAIRQSLDGVARVASIVGAMRNFGHPDGQDPAPVDIDAAIRDTATVARNEYKYVADLRLDLGGVPPVLGYPSQFNQVMLNLIVNAAHAIDHPERAGGRGTINVRSWSDDDAVYVSVADDGCGMTPETRARIFDPFFTTKAVGRGTGQGLTIVHNVVVEKHHGTVSVDSAPGQGSTFTLCLPRHAVPAGEPVPALA